jgi:hypothetical protein
VAGQEVARAHLALATYADQQFVALSSKMEAAELLQDKQLQDTMLKEMEEDSTSGADRKKLQRQQVRWGLVVAALAPTGP